jgi:hypothetical protein
MPLTDETELTPLEMYLERMYCLGEMTLETMEDYLVHDAETKDLE